MYDHHIQEMARGLVEALLSYRWAAGKTCAVAVLGG
jgi:hypothetical protein